MFKNVFSPNGRKSARTPIISVKKEMLLEGEGWNGKEHPGTTLLSDAVSVMVLTPRSSLLSEHMRASLLIPRKQNCWYLTPHAAVVKMDLSEIKLSTTFSPSLNKESDGWWIPDVGGPLMLSFFSAPASTLTAQRMDSILRWRTALSLSLLPLRVRCLAYI